jgi:hypothetical protein
MNLKVISTKPLALKQQTAAGQHQDTRPLPCYSPEPDNMFGLQPRVPAVGTKIMIFKNSRLNEESQLAIRKHVSSYLERS